MARKDSIIQIKELLVRRRDALRRALAGDLSLLEQLREQGGSDILDCALDSAHGEISSRLAEVESRELASIEKAIERIRDGVYGHCELCEGKIPLLRIKALPYATMCIECQQGVENGTIEESGGEDWGRVVDTGYSETEIRVSDLELQ
ncbi:TraR/DksA family transcriptional regulator [Botrimarina hoheduenensis]|uniref:General stress protein 16O n=1 Tax=Botrimarina hoheduenensis TaxID=2528000 RepID=A0A5C5VY46_9BACT|nr:TraR/DksA family transcriptional regulator [Botrimarina hoheduenensis]TWT42853.1 General stress protein 16O [Botrimarina hoheduenensis]